jgi:hypothetical protein
VVAAAVVLLALVAVVLHQVVAAAVAAAGAHLEPLHQADQSATLRSVNSGWSEAYRTSCMRQSFPQYCLCSTITNNMLSSQGMAS